MMYEARNAILKQGFPSIVLIVTQLLVGISQIVWYIQAYDLPAKKNPTLRVLIADTGYIKKPNFVRLWLSVKWHHFLWANMAIFDKKE